MKISTPWVAAGCLLLVVMLSAVSSAREATDWTTTKPFDWDPGYATPGTALRIEEASREQYEGAAVIEYRFAAFGFPSDDDAVMWMRQGPAYRSFPAVIDSAGAVIAGGAELFLVTGYVRGQSLDVALVSREKRAHAKVFPFPIESDSDGCRIEIELHSSKGHLFMASVSGFEIGESVRVESTYKDEHIDQVVEVPSDGIIDIPLVYGTDDRGTATLKVTGEDCEASVTYGVGRDALTSE